jgi:acyl-CoA synthetase (NDP forming)
VRHAHATGNDADVTVCELATIVAEDPGLKLLLLYLEGLPDPWNLAEAARIARRRGLPIIALKAGRSPAGQAAARSHTGSLASPAALWAGLARQTGVIRRRDLVALGLNPGSALHRPGVRPRRAIALRIPTLVH